MTRVTVNLRIISILSKRLSKPPVCFASRDMFQALTRVTSLAVPLPVSPGTAHSSDAHHLAAGASVELRWSVVSYTQVSADVSWSRSHYSLPLRVTSCTGIAIFGARGSQVSHSRHTEQGKSPGCSMGGIFPWLLSQLGATQTTLNFPRTLTFIFSITSSVNQSFP